MPFCRAGHAQPRTTPHRRTRAAVHSLWSLFLFLPSGKLPGLGVRDSPGSLITLLCGLGWLHSLSGLWFPQVSILEAELTLGPFQSSPPVIAWTDHTVGGLGVMGSWPLWLFRPH